MRGALRTMETSEREQPRQGDTERPEAAPPAPDSEALLGVTLRTTVTALTTVLGHATPGVQEDAVIFQQEGTAPSSFLQAPEPPTVRQGFLDFSPDSGE